MSKVIGLLILKFFITLTAMFLSLGLLDHNSIRWLIAIAIITTIVNFLIGDLLILLTLGNFTASVMDGILAALTAYILDSLIEGVMFSTLSLIVLVFLITVGEYFFHLYLLYLKKFKQ